MREALKIISFLLLAAFPSSLYAETCNWSIGQRNIRFFNATLTLHSRYLIEIEQSFYDEPIKNQTTALYLGYKDKVKDFSYELKAYHTGSWGNYYNATGALLSLSYSPIKQMIIYGRLNPHYDSELGYATHWEAGPMVNLTNQLGLFCTYSTIPIYRTPQRHIDLGLYIHFGRLSVYPAISYPLNTPEKYLRVLCGFDYTF